MTDDKQQPNIILVLIDTLRAGRLSCCGYNRPTSPNIDRLARSGLLFENAIVSAPWTLPSHASLLTGLYPSQHGATDENLFLRDDIPTLAQLLGESGYNTIAYAHENGWLSRDTNLMRGFEKFYDPAYKPPPPEGNRLIRKIRWKVRTTLKLETQHRSTAALNSLESHLAGNRNSDQPLFFFLHMMETHMPYRPARSAMKKFGLDKTDPDMLAYLRKNFREYRTQPEKLSDEQLKTLRTLYDACVATADKRLARLFRLVNSSRYRDNTILIITSDHGEQLGEHGLLNHWFSLYDTLLKVPIIISSPKILPKPMRITQQIQQHDLFYTILDMAGYNGDKIKPDSIRSKSFLQNIAGKSPFPEYTFAQQAYAKMTLKHVKKYNPSFDNERWVCSKQAVRSEQFKYIKYGIGLQELFDIKSDPGETKNIIKDHPDIANNLSRQLETIKPIEKQPQHDSTGPEDFDPEIKKRLEDLGYI
jgi:arylsulfatase A-like enzyme